MTMLANLPRQDGLTAMSRLVNDLFGANGERAWAPALDVVETAEALVVHVELPGIDPASVDTSVTGEYLEISGSKPAVERPENSRWYHFERGMGEFRRRVRLPFPIDVDAITAEARHGLLTITLPKRPEVLPRRIEVKVS